MTAVTTALHTPVALRRWNAESLRGLARAAVAEQVPPAVEATPARPSSPASTPWLDPAVVAMSFQRADGEWHFCPWLLAGREDLYSAI